MAAKATKLHTTLIVKYVEGADAKGKDIIKNQNFSKVKTTATEDDILAVALEIDRIYNFNAEANVIGSILMGNDSICEVIGFLNPEDFYNLKHKILYKNLKKMYEENLAVDIVTLSEKLGESLKEVGGISYITEILNSIVNTVNIKKYGEIVKEKANNRELIKLFNSAIGKLQSGEASQEELINYAQNSLLSIKTSETKENGEIERILHEFMDTL